jgi:hypothetical protein
MDDVSKTGNRLISPDEFAKKALETMRAIEAKNGLVRGSLLRAWINESPMFRTGLKRKARKNG